MKRFASLVLVLTLVLAVFAGSAAAAYKIGVLAPAVTHGWVAAVAYHAENRLKELGDEVEYRIQTSNNAEEMTAQLDDLMTWGAQAIVAFPQWEGMEVPMQRALDAGIEIVNFDIVIDLDGIYRIAGDNYDMGVQGAHYIVEKVGPEATVVILEVPTSGSVSALRKQGLTPLLKLLQTHHSYATRLLVSGLLICLTSWSSFQNRCCILMDDETSRCSAGYSRSRPH